MKRNQSLAIGDRVRYSRQWLQSTGQYAGDCANAKGVVIGLKPFGDNALAEIDWNNPDIPSRVLACNLSTVKQVQLGE